MLKDREPCTDERTLERRREPAERCCCPSCGGCSVRTFYEVSDAPVESCLVLRTRAEALQAARRPICLAVCRGCSFIFNRAHDSAVKRATTSYEEVQAFSPRFRNFTAQLAMSLIERHGLRRKNLVEIGCGNGQFLADICALGENRGIGVDPGINGSVPSSNFGPSAVRLIKDYYSEQYTELRCDAIICRHLLEHIDSVGNFVPRVARHNAKSPDAFVYFEVPDTRRILRDTAFWDLYYEHCSYFTCGSLARLLRSCRFAILTLQHGFGDQYALVECRRSNAASQTTHALEEPPNDVLYEVESFERKLKVARAAWRRLAGLCAQRGSRMVLWGSGPKAAAFTAALGMSSEVNVVVNINPNLQGKYIAGTGQQIVSPDYLTTCNAGVIVSMNPIYNDEIEATLKRMNFAPSLLSVDAPPSCDDLAYGLAASRNTHFARPGAGAP